MYTLRITTRIAAPPERCFDLARSVEAHVQSAAGTGERVVGGRTTGLMELGDEVEWEGRHLGVRQRLASRVTAMHRPMYFQDRMVRGAFRSFEHDHHFDPAAGGATVMVDVVRFAAPLGPIGWVVERVILAAYLRRFLSRRAAALKAMAEAGGGLGHRGR